MLLYGLVCLHCLFPAQLNDGLCTSTTCFGQKVENYSINTQKCDDCTNITSHTVTLICLSAQKKKGNCTRALALKFHGQHQWWV